MPFVQPGYINVQARFIRQKVGHAGVGDVCINTFVFRNDLVSPQNGYLQVRDRLNTFYTASPATGLPAIGQFMSPAISEVLYYCRPTDAAIGEPGEEVPAGVPLGNTATTMLPAELAVCSSYRAVPPYTGSRRGRIYIGPLAPNAMDNGFVQLQFMNTLREATKGLASTGASVGVTWVIASRKYGTSELIKEGYVDKHFDVQRRRDPGTEGQFGRRPADWTL